MPSASEIARKIRAYEREVDRLLARSRRLQAADVRRIRLAFARFKADALQVLPASFRLNQATIATVLATLEVQIAELERGFLRTLRGGMEEQAAVARETVELYGATFLQYGDAVPFVGVSPQTLDLASSFSAELIGLRRGGLAAKMLAEVNRALRLSALGAGGNAFEGATAVARVLGSRSWSWQAERIYRTEVLRIHSLATDTAIRNLDRITPTARSWRWSGIERQEHASIDGQTVGVDERFRVPLRTGGVALMRFPRDPSADPSATINCGCFLIPRPRAA